MKILYALIDGGGAKKHPETIGIRPEHLSLSKESGLWNGRVRVAEHLGSDTFLYVAVDDIGTLTVRADSQFNVSTGDRIHIDPDPPRIHRFGSDGRSLT